MNSFLKKRLPRWASGDGAGSRSRQIQMATRDVIIRDAVLAELGDVCADLGYLLEASSGGSQPGDGSSVEELAETSAQLCQCVEAMLLHGLKDSFLWQTVAVMGGGGGASIDRRPEPNFWPPLLVFTHRDTIEQIQQHSQLQSDIGHCRAWIRTALNDGLLASYVATMRQDSRALEPYYRRVAFVRDADRMAVAQQLLGDVEARMMASTTFVLSVNTSLLNRWPDRPLQLAGLYAPAVRAYPVSAGFDVVTAINDDDPDDATVVEAAGEALGPSGSGSAAISMPRRLPIDQPFEQSIRNSPFTSTAGAGSAFPGARPYDAPQIGAANYGEDGGTVTPQPEDDLADLLRRMEAVERRRKGLRVEADGTSDERKSDDDGDTSAMGNSIRSSGWSSDGRHLANDDDDDDDDEGQQTDDDGESIPSTFSALVAQHRKNAPVSLNPAEVWQRFESSLAGGMEDVASTELAHNTSGEHIAPAAAAELPTEQEAADDELTNDLLSFEVVAMDANTASTPTVGGTHFTMAQLRQLVAQSSQLARERGIDAQDFRCAGCPTPLSVGSGTGAQLCHFSGAYFCAGCMAPRPHAIPARIIYNWDFERRPVSRTAAAFLAEFQHQPFVDLKLLNPAIYAAVREMATLQSLRIQLNFVRAYLSTCSTQAPANPDARRPPPADTGATDDDHRPDAPPPATDDTFVRLQRLLWPRHYLFDTVHRYSLADLLALGQLADTLRQAVDLGVRHVRGCTERCTPKGFICELCQRHDSVLFPFDVATTVRCDRCSAVFHGACFEATGGDADADGGGAVRHDRPCPRCERRKMWAKRSVSETGSVTATAVV